MHSQKFSTEGRDTVTHGENTCVERGRSPVELEDFGPDVWNPRGIKILGTPVGSQEFISEVCEEQLQQEGVCGRQFLGGQPAAPDLATLQRFQCGWEDLGLRVAI